MKNRIPTFIIGFVVPFVVMFLMIPVYNRVEPRILGFPFMYFWMFAGMFFTSLCLWIAYTIDPKNKENETQE